MQSLTCLFSTGAMCPSLTSAMNTLLHFVPLEIYNNQNVVWPLFFVSAMCTILTAAIETPLYLIPLDIYNKQNAKPNLSLYYYFNAIILMKHVSEYLVIAPANLGVEYSKSSLNIPFQFRCWKFQIIFRHHNAKETRTLKTWAPISTDPSI